MSDEQVIEGAQVESPEISADVQAIIDTKIAERAEEYEKQLRGVNRANSKLTMELNEKSVAGKTVEERLEAIERERLVAVRRADTMSAFSRNGLSEEWRGLFDLEDPEERAAALKDLLENERKTIQKTTATQFSRDPEPVPGEGPRSYTVDQLRGKSVDEINKLWNEGRVKAS